MFKRMFPELHVSDCEAAATFFENALGYRRGYTLMEKGAIDFAVMEHPHAGLNFRLHHMMPASASTEPRYLRLFYETDDIKSLCAELRTKGFDVTGPEATDYGATIARLTGPDGYVIWFEQWPKA